MSGCSKNESQTIKEDEPYQQKIFLNEKAKAIVNADNTFGFNLFKTINDSTPENENIIISPLSVSIALGMTYNGAESETKTAMENTLDLEGMTVEEINESYKTLINALTTVDPKVTMNIPNSIWYRDSFSVEADFIATNQDYFKAQVYPLDFNDPNSVNVINNWVSESTNDKIPMILNEIDPLNVMFLINAIYFFGSWKYEFDEQNTQSQAFYLADGTTKAVDMMSQHATLSYTSNELFEAVNLYYGSENFSMVILLPKNEHTPDDIIFELNEQNWADWMGGFNEADIQISLPKFKLEYEKTLNDQLKYLGMEIAFDPYSADFSNINPDEQLYISFVKHKTFIDVNEMGTEAAAVTVVGISFTSIGTDTPYYFTVNKPFLFAITERDTQSIIFLGKVMEPEYEE
jgi:serpin B